MPVRPVCLLLFLVFVFCLSFGCSSQTGRTRLNPAEKPEYPSAETTMGIKVEGIRLIAASSMLDFRYRVIDPERTGPLLDRSVQPYLMHLASGKVLGVPVTPKVGPLRQTTRKPEAGRVYWLFFNNPGRMVKSGNRVAIVIGDYRIDNLTVE